MGGQKVEGVERVSEASQICTPILCFLETTTYGSADLAGSGESVKAHEIGKQKVEGVERVSEACQICTPKCA